MSHCVNDMCLYNGDKKYAKAQIITSIVRLCVGMMRLHAARFPSSPFLCLIFWPAQRLVTLSPARYLLSCASWPTSRWPSLLPSRLLLPHSDMHTRLSGTIHTDRATLLVATPAKSISTSVSTTPGSPSMQSDSALAVRLTSRVILCVLFVHGSDACAHHHPSLDRRTQLGGKFSPSACVATINPII